MALALCMFVDCAIRIDEQRFPNLNCRAGLVGDPPGDVLGIMVDGLSLPKTRKLGSAHVPLLFRRIPRCLLVDFQALVALDCDRGWIHGRCLCNQFGVP